MIKHFLKIWGFNSILFLASSAAAIQQQPVLIQIDAALAKKIGDAIWQNECGKKVEPLIHWNVGETFPSLGIGHFIWYPASVNVRTYQETFPDLICFINQSRNVPAWLLNQIKVGAPWQSKQDLDSRLHEVRLQELRRFLTDTIDLQVQFIIKRLQGALPLMLEKLTVRERALVHNRFVRLAREPRGVYALADYAHFKGEGILDCEQYNGTRWGLLQVLLGMDDTQKSVTAFVHSARCILQARVQAAPKERNEERWLFGWLNRVNGYKTICFT